jgi:putative PIN family toxin of toxin-antitoxin system
MESPEIVLDTNVLIAGLRSRRGASYRILDQIDSGRFQLNVSVALILEYEEVCKRLRHDLKLTNTDVDDLLDYLCTVSRRPAINFLWRPYLHDPDDDRIFELAVAATCSHIVTFNQKDFRGVERFGIHALTPGDFLKEIGDIT